LRDQAAILRLKMPTPDKGGWVPKQHSLFETYQVRFLTSSMKMSAWWPSQTLREHRTLKINARMDRVQSSSM